jgi:hypothetical protein
MHFLQTLISLASKYINRSIDNCHAIDLIGYWPVVVLRCWIPTVRRSRDPKTSHVLDEDDDVHTVLIMGTVYIYLRKKNIKERWCVAF